MAPKHAHKKTTRTTAELARALDKLLAATPFGGAARATGRTPGAQGACVVEVIVYTSPGGRGALRHTFGAAEFAADFEGTAKSAVLAALNAYTRSQLEPEPPAKRTVIVDAELAAASDRSTVAAPGAASAIGPELAEAVRAERLERERARHRASAEHRGAPWAPRSVAGASQEDTAVFQRSDVLARVGAPRT